MAGRELLFLGSSITGCCPSKSSGLEGCPPGHPQRTRREPCFQKEHKGRNFQASWWGRSQRWTDGRGGTAGHSQGWHLSLGMDSRKFSFWRADCLVLHKENWKVTNPNCSSDWGASLQQNNLETPEQNFDSLKSPLKSRGVSAGHQVGSAWKLRCLTSEKGMTMLETLRRGWEQLLFFTQD